jgi:hypothetical protein
MSTKKEIINSPQHKFSRSKSVELIKPNITIPQLRDEFLQTTNVHGFGFIYESKTLFERILWILAMLVFAGLLTNDVWSLSTTYINKPTVAEVRKRIYLNINNMFR